MAEAERIRAFVAVPPDARWAESARELLGGIRSRLPEASWTRPESWHVTLRFLGEVPSGTLAAFARGFGETAPAVSGAELLFGGAVVLPPRGPARVLAAGFAPGAGLDALARLASDAEVTARGLGLPSEDRAFKPHVTFARLRRPWPRPAVETYRRELSAWRAPRWPLSECVLFASRLGPGGAVHTPLARWTLSGATEAARP